MATKPALPQALPSFVTLLPVATLALLALAGAAYVLSAAGTLGRDDFTGAAAARDEIVVMLAIGGIALIVASVAWLARRWLVGPLVCLAFATGALVMAVTSGQVGALLATGVLLGWSWSAGCALLRGMGIGAAHLGATAHTALSIGIGLAALSYGVLVLALLGIVGDLTLALLLLAGLAPLPSNLRALEAEVRTYRLPLPDPAETVALVSIAGAMLVGLAVCLTPQTAFDALHYHLALPKYVLEAGSFVERPDIIQSYFPLGMEMTYVPAFWLGGEATANLLHWAFAPLTVVLVWSTGDSLFGRPAGAIGGALYGLMPLVLWESTAVTSDLPLAFFLFSSVFLMVVRANSGREIGFACGLCAGLALAFKVVAAIYIVPLTLVFLGSLLLSRSRARWGVVGWPLLRFAVGGLVGGAPWLVLRYLQVGNPVLPLLNNVFKSDRWAPVNERFDLDQFGIGTSPGDFLTFWWHASADPLRFGQPVPDWMLGLALLAPLGIVLMSLKDWLLARETGGQLGAVPRPVLIWLLAAGAALLSWFLFSQYLRYGLPAFALLAPLGGWTLVEVVRATERPAVLSGALAASLGVLGVAGIIITVGALSFTPGHFPTDVLLGRETEEEYRDRWIPNRNAIAFFDQATDGTDDSGAILGFPYNYFASNRLYDVIVPATLSPFRRIVEQQLNYDDMSRDLVDENVRWLIYDSNNPFAASEWPPSWLAEGVLSPEFIAGYTETAFDENGVFVYRIVAPD